MFIQGTLGNSLDLCDLPFHNLIFSLKNYNQRAIIYKRSIPKSWCTSYRISDMNSSHSQYMSPPRSDQETRFFR